MVGVEILEVLPTSLGVFCNSCTFDDVISLNLLRILLLKDSFDNIAQESRHL